MGKPTSESAVAKRLAELENELAERERELELLSETAVDVSGELNLDRVFQLIADRARELIQAETLLIPVLENDLDQYTYRAGSGMHVEEIIGESLPIAYGVCGWVWRNKRPWWRGVLDELDEQERTHWEKDAGTLILVPLIGKNHFLGGLAGMNKIGGGEFTRRDLTLLQLFASQAAIAIENAMAFDELETARYHSEHLQEELRELNTDLMNINQELEFLALYDQLTQLPNSSLLKDRLNQAVLTAEREKQPLAVMMIDLDHFKEVNDSLGHEAGDELLTQVSKRFTRELRHSDTVARLGGDEFGIVLPGADLEQATQIAHALLKALEPEFDIAGHKISIAASIGLAVYPELGDDASTLMRHADYAMYAAKRMRLGISVYDEREDNSSTGHLALIGDVRRALQNQEFELYYQPKVDIATRQIIGVEALSRWKHAERGFIKPDLFVTMLEQTGLIHAFTEWVLETAFEQCSRWRGAGWNISMAVNISVQNLLEPDFVKLIEKLLRKWDVAGNIILELTENVFLSDYQRVNEILRNLCLLGIRFSIDDFGTGHSSLSRLKRLPVSELKIDRSFVSDMAKGSDDAIIVQSTIDLARNLGLGVVAEGVENESVLMHLQKLGCDVAQGFHISKPLPAGEFESFIRDSHWPLAIA